MRRGGQQRTEGRPREAVDQPGADERPREAVDQRGAEERPREAGAQRGAAQRQAPADPTRLTLGGWGGVLRRTVAEFRRDNLTNLAAALTYYGILAIFPALLALVSILGLIGHSAIQPLIENLGKAGPGPARSIVTSALQNLEQSRGAASGIFIAGLAGALWSASGYVAGFMWAANRIYDVEEGRPIWKTVPVRLGVTLVTVALLVVCCVAVVVTGGLARQIGDVIGVGGTAVTVWDIAKWPVLVVIVSLMLAILYWAAPNVKHPGFRWLSPGGVLAVAVWIIASGAFALYVANFSSYNKTYGSLAAIVIFLVWLWITNVAILLGAELNAELERGRLIQGGFPAEKEPFLEPRDTRKMQQPQ
ncbi:MAG TPA: YihY/virulence factor BrkB family protein [Solirubrobacteraceae bacterium]|nr:YihY/virulence factor BrkB family protein [Solirubrobacteraceae bacterium]